MASLNVVALLGRAGSDPESWYFESDSCKATVNLAVDESVSGEMRTHWISLVALAKTAEVLANYVTKGKQVTVQGSLRQDNWEDKDARSVAVSMSMLSECSFWEVSTKQDQQLTILA